MRTKKSPLRRCTGCHEMKDKAGLIRVARSAGGGFLVDFTGKKEGRGAYLCRSAECFAKSKKSRGFERSFKSKIPKEIYEELESALM